MPKSDRTTVRPVPQISVTDKKFKKVVTPKRPVKLDEAHPFVVVADLKRGSLKSLAKYVRETGGVSDPEIANELLHLIDGTERETAYRILVVDHPDKIPAKGGRPKTRRPSMTTAETMLAERFDEILLIEKKHELALNALAAEAQVSPAKISRVLRKRKRCEQQDAEAAEKEHSLNDTLAAREKALAKLRALSKS
jgi:hypothetical protein